MHEKALVGAQLRLGSLVGSFDAGGHYVTPPAGTTEWDLEQDLFGAVRLFRRAQIAALVPFVETRRKAGATTDFGGGFGDANLSARYDFLEAAEKQYVPGIAVLAGITFPTGVPPESASGPLAAGATGIGAFQINGGLSLEKALGPWLVDLSGILAARTSRTVGAVSETEAPQISVLGALTYVTFEGIALALSASFAYEGDATIDGRDAPDSERYALTLGAGAVFPVSDTWRMQTGIAWVPPGLGRNQPATLGLNWTLVHTWF